MTDAGSIEIDFVVTEGSDGYIKLWLPNLLCSLCIDLRIHFASSVKFSATHQKDDERFSNSF